MNIIDLFSGCGGLTEGFRRKEFNIICHVEMDEQACNSLLLREAYYYLKNNDNLKLYTKYITGNMSKKEFYSLLPKELKKRIIHDEIGAESINHIFDRIDSILHSEKVFGIIGGPPCQAYSTIGRALNEKKKKNDDRIYLYEYYIQFLKKYQPEFFIFENVKGLISFKDEYNEYLFPKMKEQFSKTGYALEEKIINTKDYGVPQSRERLIIFGQKNDSSSQSFFNNLDDEKLAPITIKQLFNDLPAIADGEEGNTYRAVRPNKFVKKYLRYDNIPLTQNITRPHTDRDKEIYRIAVQKKENGETLKYNTLPEKLRTHRNTSSFLDRYKVLDENGISHTVVAHISKDGHYYIHPDITQNRSISVREAARIQTFPDNFYFENSRTSAYKQIGNAVPPLLSEKFSKTIVKIYRNKET